MQVVIETSDWGLFVLAGIAASVWWAGFLFKLWRAPA